MNSPVDKNQLLNGHKKFSFEGKYKKNIDTIIKSPQGDLIALDTCTEKIYDNKIQINDQEFITDELGFRNKPGSIIKSNYILVGNSIIMGGAFVSKKYTVGKIKYRFTLKILKYSYRRDWTKNI